VGLSSNTSDLGFSSASRRAKAAAVWLFPAWRLQRSKTCMGVVRSKSACHGSGGMPASAKSRAGSARSRASRGRCPPVCSPSTAASFVSWILAAANATSHLLDHRLQLFHLLVHDNELLGSEKMFKRRPAGPQLDGLGLGRQQLLELLDGQAAQLGELADGRFD